MRQYEKLIALFRGVADLLAEEAGRNPDFAERADALLAELPAARPKESKSRAPKPPAAASLPDVHAEFTQRGEAEFRAWLRGLALPTLRALIAQQDLDPTRKTSRWRGADKLADYVADGLAARRARGGGFLTGNA